MSQRRDTFSFRLPCVCGPLVRVSREEAVEIGLRGRKLTISAFGHRPDYLWVDARRLKRERRRHRQGKR